MRHALGLVLIAAGLLASLALRPPALPPAPPPPAPSQAAEPAAPTAPSEPAPACPTPQPAPPADQPPLSLTVPPPEETLIDLAGPGRPFLGFGLGIHPADVAHRALLSALRPRWVRMEVGPSWNHLPEPIPSGADDARMDAYIARWFNGDSPERLPGAQWAFKVLRELDARVLLVTFELPWHWLEPTPQRALREAHAGDLVSFHVALLLFLKHHGMIPFGLELANEPDGHWNGHIRPEMYARVVRRARAELDRRGLGQVQILGPGLTYLRGDDLAPRWIGALSSEEAAALWGWSTHAWDEVEFRQSRPEFVYGVWGPLRELTARFPPRPIVVTEYATEVTRYRGVDHPSPRDGVHPCASDLEDYAVRVLANSIAHLRQGAKALILYRLADPEWDRPCWGLVRRPSQGGGLRPLARALSGLLAELPERCELVELGPALRDDPLELAAFRSADRVVLLLANASAGPARRRLRLRGLPAARLLADIPFGETGSTAAALSRDGADWLLSVVLPHQSTRVVVIG